MKKFKGSVTTIYVLLGIMLCVNTGFGHRCTATNLVAGNGDKSLESPSYGSYANNVRWCRRIIAEEDRVIIIALDHVDLQGQAGNCVDFLDILDGDHSRSKSLGRFCQTNSTIVKTTSDEAYLSFRTDQTQTSIGFKLRYRQSEDEDNSIWSSALAGIAGGLAVIWIFMCCCCLCSKKQKVINRDPSSVHPIQQYSTEVNQSSAYRQHGDRVSRPRVWENSSRDRSNSNIYHIVFRTNRRKQEQKIRTNLEPTKPPVYEEEDPSPAKLPAYDDIEEEFSRIISPPPTYRELEQEGSSLPVSPPPAYPANPSSDSSGPYL
ncbi:uncharacterized protein LOC117328962 [Pecten maximus]|uniref:uncharacterized protein LOC117328962 n=1 Tax=Pecten maximus TaxID=6579 RepID=UPI001459082F|nr:uncharacterized protein LOC117328962 [Pecten maximus]